MTEQYSSKGRTIEQNTALRVQGSLKSEEFLLRNPNIELAFETIQET